MKSRKLLAAALALCMMLSLLPAVTVNAEEYSGTCGENLTWSLDTETGVLTIEGTGDMEDYDRGESPWYDYRDQFTTVSLPEGLTSIGWWAFADTKITEIEIPDSVTAIGYNAFAFSGLVSVTIPCNVLDFGNGYYGDGMYDGDQLDSVFDFCSSLTEIIVDEGNTNYASQDGVLYREWGSATALICYPAGKTETSFDVPDGVTKISCDAFSGCTNLTSLSIPATVEELYLNSFGTTGLTEFLVDSDHEQYASRDGLLYSKDMTRLECYPAGRTDTSFVIPEGVTDIGYWAFQDNDYLTDVVIPEGFTDVTRNAFYGCSNLESVTIPASVTTIGRYAFRDCTSLTSIYFGGTLAQWDAIEKDEQWDEGAGDYTVYYQVCDEHDWTDATCTAPKTCSVCGATEGEALLHTWDGDQCSVCGAYSYSVGLEYTLSDDGTYYIVTGIGECADTEVIIPSTYNGLPVAVIGGHAFWGCETVTDVILPNSITSIESHAIVYCGMTSITIPASVVTMEDGAIARCGSLKEILVDVNNANYTSQDGVLYSKDMTKLVSYPAGKTEASFAVPEGVLVIADSAFWGSKLTDIEISNGVVSIGSSAFTYCSSLCNVHISDSVVTIGSSAFSDCEGLTSVCIPAGVTSIGAGAFSKCSGLTEILVDVNSNCYTSKDGVLYTKDMTQLHSYPAGKADQSFVIPDSVTSFSQSAFMGSSNLKDVIIPVGVTSITHQVFRECSNLTTITIPAGITEIGYTALYRCTNLEEIRYGGTEEAWNAIDKWDGWDKNTGEYTISYSVFCGEGHDFQEATCATPATCSRCGATEGEALGHIWDDATCTAPKTCSVCGATEGEALPHTWNDATCVEEKVCQVCGERGGYGDHSYVHGVCSVCGAYNDSVGLEYTLSDDGTYYSVSGIGECTDTEVIIPSTYNGLPVIVIGEFAFENCTNLTSITIPDGVTTIEYGAFYRAQSLTSVTIPDSVTSIGDYAFAACTSLTSITIPESVTNIGRGAFAACTSLTSITIPKSVTLIGAYAFEGCTALESITLCCELMGYYIPTFSECTKLTDIYVRSTVVANGGYNFWTKSQLNQYAERIYVESTIEEVGQYVLAGFPCTNPAETVEVDGITYILYTKGEHDYEVTAEVAPTCTEDGSIEYTCTKCGYTYTQTIAAGHTWDENHACTTCGYALECDLQMEDLTLGEDGVYYTADGHMAVIAVSAPLEGWLGGSSLADYVDAYGEGWFSMTYWEQLVAATNEDGYAPLTEETLVWILDVILAAGWEYDETYLTHYIGFYIDRSHVHDYTAVVTEPTCTEAGYTTYTCACGDSYEVTLSATGHDFNITTTAPTCTEEGKTVYTCTVCGYVHANTQPATGHAAGEWTVVKEATATEIGLKQQLCTVCGQVVAEEVIPAIGEPEPTDPQPTEPKPTEPEKPDDVQTKVETRPNYSDEDIPDELKQTQFDTVEKIEAELKIQLEKLGAQNDNSVLYDVVLMYKDADGTWQKADETHFPADGKLTVTIPLPAGTSPETHIFHVSHMFTSSAFGKIPGDVETFMNVQPVSDGNGGYYLVVEVTGLSPILVCAEEVPEGTEPQPTEPEPSVPETTIPEATVPETTAPGQGGEGVPNTGENIFLFVLFAMMTLAAPGSLVLKKRI